MEELNDMLMERTITWTRTQPHPEIADKTIWEVFEAERASLVPYRGAFDGFHEGEAGQKTVRWTVFSANAAVSKTCLVRFDHNKYSVEASAVGRPVEVHAYADRVDLRQDGPPSGP